MRIPLAVKRFICFGFAVFFLTGIETAQGGAQVIQYDPVIVPLTGEQFSDPCSGAVLGYFTSGTLTLTAQAIATPSGMSLLQVRGAWTDLYASGSDGATYHVIAHSSDAEVLGDNAVFQIYTITNSWIVIGPDGQQYNGHVVFGLHLLAGELPSFEFVHATRDSQCL
jgi:hypothetical protein